MGRDKKISIKREKVVDKSGTKFLSSKKNKLLRLTLRLETKKKR
jgi:hypothetical protein